MAKNVFMGSQLYTRVIALFMILLVLTLPVSFAASISGVGLRGTINAGEVVKPGDTISATVNISATEAIDAATLHQRLRLGTSTVFTSCQGSATTLGQYTCFASFVLNPSQSSIIINPIDVLLYTDATKTVEVDREASRLIVDGQAPTVSIPSLIQFGSRAEVTVLATDKALSTNVPPSCAGIASVALFWLNGTVSTPITTLTGDNSCSFTNGTTFEIPSSGLRQLCAKATDRAGLNSQTCVARTFDISRPAISAIDIVTAAGPTRYITGEGTPIYVTFNASANSDPNGFNVTIDDERIEPITCNAAGSCRAGPFSLTEAKTYVVKIAAQTAQGMTASATQNIAITVDDSAPTFVWIKSNLTIGTKVYFKPNLSLTAHFAEEATGLGNKNARLVIEGTALGAPTRCVKASTGGWDCVWERVSYVSPKQGNLSVIASATDLLGNVGENGNATLIYDTLPPEVSFDEDEVTFIGASGAMPFGASGSVIKVSFNVSDISTPISAKGDFSVFEPVSNQSTNTCTATRCDISSRPVGVGPYGAPASITVSDALGNNRTFTTQRLTVLRTSNATNTSYFRHSLKLSPAALEKTTFPYINQRAYAVIDVRGMSDVSVLKIDFKQCRNIPVVTVGANSSITPSAFSTTSASTGDTRLFKSNPQVTVVNASQIFVAFTFKATELNQSNIQFLCDIDVMGRLGGETFIPRETETVLVNFSTYSLSVGELGANYDKKLQDQINKAKNHIGGKLETFEKLFEIAKKICNLWKLWLVVSSTISIGGSTVSDASGPLAGTFFGIPAAIGIDLTGKSICTAGEVAQDLGDLTFKTMFSGFCSFVNCEIGLDNVVSAVAGSSLGGDAVSDLAGKTGGVIPSINTIGEKNKIAANYVNDMISAINPQDTLAGAIANLCIPGIIRALRRAQQIECQYALCLRDEVPNGVPVEACDQSYEYSSCVYKTANFFILFAIWDAFINKIKALISDPFALSGFVIGGAACYIACTATAFTGIPAKICVTAKAIGKIGSIVQMIVGIKNDWTQKDYEAQDYCAKLE